MDSVSVYEDAIGRSTSHVPPADYIVRIKSYSLLAEEAIVEKYESGAFQARGHKWKLVIYPKGNKSKNAKDHISLYLAVADTSSLTFGWEVNAVSRLFLLDQNQDSYSVAQDAVGKERRRFNGLKLEWGFDQFIPLEAFNDASNGYPVDDTCVFGAEVFVKERNIIEGECLSMAKITSGCKFVWMVENFSKLDERRQESQVFCAGEHKWKIVLYPMGNGCGDGDHLSLFLAFEDSTLEAIKVYARYTLRILDQVGAKHKSFQALNEPETGFLVNDVCLVEAEVAVLGISTAM
ncbi:TRAF-like family protein [Citrus sinensis]|nr:TRAF-like family protein [Citrus sinensis]